MLQSFFFLSILYPFIGFLWAQGFLMYLKLGFILTITTIPATAYGHMLSIMSESTRITTEFASLFNMYFLIIAGFYKKLEYIWWAKYTSLFFYSYELMLILLWSDVDYLGNMVFFYLEIFIL